MDRRLESLIQVLRSQLFIRVHNETLSVVAMRVCNPDRSPFGIDSSGGPTRDAPKTIRFLNARIIRHSLERAYAFPRVRPARY